MDFAEGLTKFFQWAWGLVMDIPALFGWLVSPLPRLTALVGFDVSPIGLLGATALIIGIVRAIFGLILD